MSLPLDFTKFSIGADGVTPLYETRHMILRDDMADRQGAFGAVSMWEVPRPPWPTRADALLADSDSDDEIEPNTVVVKVQTFDMKLPRAAYDYQMTKSALTKATKLTACDLVRFCFLETKVGDVKRIITIMERLTYSARKLARVTVGTPEHTELAMKFGTFLEKLHRCLVMSNATFTDMKTNNVGYCSRDQEFRLIDLDSIDQGMYTYRYAEDFELEAQTRYAFGVAMAKFLLPYDADLTAAFSATPLDAAEAASKFDRANDVVQALLGISPESDRAALYSIRKLLLGARAVIAGTPPPPPPPPL